MRFAAPTPTPKGLARRLPPAVFPAVMGLFGLGLLWRRAGQALALPPGIGEAILGAVSLLFLFFAGGYALKFMRRPAVLAEELRLLPGRLGLSALAACLYLFAAALAPHAPGAARLIACATLPLHAALIALILRHFLTGPASQRRYSAAGHLYFVSPVVGALSLAVLGLSDGAAVLFAGSICVAALIWAGGLRELLSAPPHPPLRPLLALHLAPAAVAGLTAQALGLAVIAAFAAVLALILLAALTAALPKLLASGFSALWSAFTFPLAATAALWLGQGGMWAAAGTVLLIAATLIVPAIAFRVLKLWAGGQLAVRTNAASA